MDDNEVEDTGPAKLQLSTMIGFNGTAIKIYCALHVLLARHGLGP